MGQRDGVSGWTEGEVSDGTEGEVSDGTEGGVGCQRQEGEAKGKKWGRREWGGERVGGKARVRKELERGIIEWGIERGIE